MASQGRTTRSSAAAAAPPAAPPATDTNYHPAQALPPAPKTTSAQTVLAAAPATRVPVLRPSTGTPRALNLVRPSNREAYLAQATGVVSAAPCGHCARGVGPWTECVVVAQLFGGSCANCHYGGEGVRCSLRPGKYFYPFLFTHG